MNKIEELERRIAALEAAPSLRYVGVWRDGTDYPPQTAVTRSGSTWITIAGARAGQMPGLHGDDDEGSPWQLAVKRGRDGRDGKDAR